MTHAVGDVIVQTASSTLYVALGVWILTLKPRSLQTTLLAAFAILFGMTFLPTDLAYMFHLFGSDSLIQEAIQLPVGMLAYVAALGLAWAVPKPLEDRRLLGTALALGFAVPLVIEGLTVGVPETYQGTLPLWIDAALDLFIGGTFYSAFFLLALRARPVRNPSRADVTQLALLGVALAMLDAFVRGAAVSNLVGNLARNQPVVAVWNALFVVLYVLVAGVWGWNMVQADDETASIHRAAMLGILGVFTAGAVYFVAFPAADPSSNIMRGVMRTLGVALLAYGVLRHDLAGLDAKVEWGVSKTTVAGIFVAVFFIVSEGAQELFSGFAGSEWLGILAAGALLFALAPIQRAADELAARAVPGGAAHGDGLGTDAAEARYRDAVETALADGEVTEDEAHHLAEKATELGITSARAYEIRREAEREDETTGGRSP